MSESSNGSAQVLDVLRDLYAQQNVEAFVARVVVSLPRLIATDMTLAARPRTVAKHLERIFRKLGVETRTAAAVSAINHRQA